MCWWFQVQTISWVFWCSHSRHPGTNNESDSNWRSQKITNIQANRWFIGFRALLWSYHGSRAQILSDSNTPRSISLHVQQFVSQTSKRFYTTLWNAWTARRILSLTLTLTAVGALLSGATHRFLVSSHCRYFPIDQMINEFLINDFCQLNWCKMQNAIVFFFYCCWLWDYQYMQIGKRARARACECAPHVSAHIAISTKWNLIKRNRFFTFRFVSLQIAAVASAFILFCM